jgi:hypothetical protein
MKYLNFEASENADGDWTLEACAATAAGQHPAVLAEVQSVLDWARAHFPHTQGPLDEGMDWDDDLQITLEAGGWHAVTLTLAASARFAEAFLAAFGDA